MKLRRTRTAGPAALALIGALALTVAACGPDSVDGGGNGDNGGGNGDTAGGSELSGDLPGAGASSMESAQIGWIAGFNEQSPNVQVSYDAIGSGDGRAMFINGGTLFAGSDAYFDEEEIAAATERCFGGEPLELPLYISPIAIIYNLPEVTAENINMTAETVAGIFAGKITNWNDPAIAESNPDVTLPDVPIVPVNRADPSGTTENFTEYLSAAAPDAWTYGPVEDWPVSGTLSGNQTQGMVDTVTNTAGAIGYADASRAGELGTVAIGVGEDFVPYSAEAAAAVIDASPPTEDASENRLTIELARDTTEAGAYPIVLVAYTIACSTYDDQAAVDNVKAYLSYVASPEGQERAADPTVAGSAPISDDLRTRVQAAIDGISLAE